MKRKLLVLLAIVSVIGFIGLGVHSIMVAHNKIEFQNIELDSTIDKLKTNELKQQYLNQQLRQVLQSKDASGEKVKQLEDQNKQLEDEKQQLESQLQAKLSAKQLVAAKLNNASNTVTLTGTASAASSCGDNEYANYIYDHESHCSTTAVNSIGCRGIGQACPGDALPCGNDYACQNSYFTNYANTHCDYHLGYPICYNGWAGAYAFWVTYHYW